VTLNYDKSHSCSEPSKNQWLNNPVYYQWLTFERPVKVKDYVKKELDRAERLGAGTYLYYHQVGGRVIYNSALSKRAEGLDGDLLKEFVEQSHKRGLKFVISWLATSPACGEQLMEHPDWAQRAPDGQFMFKYQTFICYNSPYRDFLFSQVREILRNYEVDAIYFDQIPIGCFCEYCKNRYVDMYQEPFPELKTEQVYTNGSYLYPLPGDAKRLGVSRSTSKKLHEFVSAMRVSWVHNVRRIINDERPDCQLVLNRIENVEAEDVRGMVDAFLPECGLPWANRLFGIEHRSLERHLTGVYGGRKPVWEVVKYDKMGVRAGTLDRMKTLMCNAISNDHVPIFRDQDTIALSLPELQEQLFKTTRLLEKVRQSKADLCRYPYVALLHSKNSFHFSIDLTLKSFFGMAQFLAQQHIPFSVVSEEEVQNKHLETKLLIVPNSVCLEKETLNAIESYCDAGGNIIATARAGELDKNEKPHERDVLAELCGIKRIVWNSNIDFGDQTPRIKENPIPARHGASFRFVRVADEVHPAISGQEGALTDFNYGHVECENLSGQTLADICVFDQSSVNVPYFNRRIPFPGEPRYPMLVISGDQSKRAYFAAPVGNAETRMDSAALRTIMTQTVHWCGGPLLLQPVDLPPSIKMTIWGGTEQKRVTVLLHATELIDGVALGYNSARIRLACSADKISSCKSLVGGKVELVSAGNPCEIVVDRIQPYEALELTFK